MMTPFFERPASVIEWSKKSIEGIHSVPEPAEPKFFDGKRQGKWSETPQKKFKSGKYSEERTNSKDALKKQYERYTELSSILNSQ